MEQPPKEPGLGWMLLLTFSMLPVTIAILMALQGLGLLK